MRKYVLIANVYFINPITNEEYTLPRYVATHGAKCLLTFRDRIDENTKVFKTATEAGKYLDKHFGDESRRSQFSKMDIIEII